MDNLPGRISPGKSNLMKVSEIMSREPVVVAPGTTLCETAQLMRDLDVGMIPVCDGNTLQGTITDRDIAIRGVASQLDPASGVDEVMTKNVLYCFEDDSIEKAAKLMEDAQVRRLVVLTRDKQLIGILSLGDLATRTEERATVAEAVKAISEPAFH
jgi:CBS domain-containing protein